MARLLCGWIVALLLAGCATTGTPRDSMDRVAEDYVRLTLEMGARDEGYVDAYYGPADWKRQAQASPRALPALAQAAAALQARLRALPRPAEPLAGRRRVFLDGQLTAARTRLRMLQGEKLSFADEAEGLFGVRPELRPLSDYDPVIARIDRLVPGEGPLSERVEAYANRLTIPRERLDAVMRAAIAECRARTLRHIALPPGESFQLEFVTNKSWSGYNYYQGNFRSLIQVNTDLPVRISRAVDLGCHEGYPGHHVYNVLLERDLARGRGWVEYQVYPLYSPQSLIAEGSANYGIDLAFPGPERALFEAAALYPLAGLRPEEATRYVELQRAMEELGGARFTIARDLLEGRISREQAITLTQRYQLVGRKRAEQSIAFAEQYRSYVINYGLGKDLVRTYVERAADPATRWQRMRRILSEPTVPTDLRRP